MSEARNASSAAANAMKAAQAAQSSADAAAAAASAAQSTADSAMSCCNENKDRIKKQTPYWKRFEKLWREALEGLDRDPADFGLDPLLSPGEGGLDEGR